MGGANNGQLGLGLTTAKHVLVSAISYTHLVHLGVVAPGGATQHETVGVRDDYARSVRIFREVTDIKKVIVNHIVQAIEKYTLSLRSRNTNTIYRTVTEILTHLFDRWGIVNNEELQTKESEIREMVYDLMEPIIEHFNELEDLQKFGAVA